MSNLDHLSDVNLLENIWDIISVIAVLIFGCYFISVNAKYFNATKIRGLSLYLWHSLFCFVYIFTTSIIGGDSIWYYTESLIQKYEFSFGTTSTLYFTTFLTVVLGLNYIGTFLVYNILGSIGLIAVDASLRHVTKDKSGFVKSLSLIIVLVPSMSYWSSAIGKDAIQFMATGLLLWSSIDFKKRNLMFLISILIMFTVRPHICAFAIVAFTFSMLIIKSISFTKKITFLFICLAFFLTALPFLLGYIGWVGSLSIESLLNYVELRQGYNLDGGGSIDISQMSLLYQLFTYLFRPLPYEAHSALALLSSIDNFLILIVFVLSFLSVICLKKPKFILNHPTENRWFLLIFSTALLILLSITTANSGIAARQKWMVMPILLYFAFLFMRVRLSDKPKFKKA